LASLTRGEFGLRKYNASAENTSSLLVLGNFKVDGIMNFTKCQNILAKNLVASARLKLSCKWMFQQDINPKHTSTCTKKWLIDHKNQHFAMAISVSGLEPH
jgi:hypothetical protein